MNDVKSPNLTRFRPLSWLKSWVVPTDVKPRAICRGVFKSVVVNLDFKTHTQLYLGLWEAETYACIRKGLRSAQWAVDIGAGTGELVILFAKQPACQKVIAIEPNATEVRRMEANIALNALDKGKIEILQTFAGAGEQSTHIAIDDLKLPPGTKGFIKLDVDGFEAQVLRSSKRVLQEGLASWLIETHSGELEIECERILKDAGYSTQIIKNAWWRSIIPEKRVVAHNRWLFAEKI